MLSDILWGNKIINAIDLTLRINAHYSLLHRLGFILPNAGGQGMNLTIGVTHADIIKID